MLCQRGLTEKLVTGGVGSHQGAIDGTTLGGSEVFVDGLLDGQLYQGEHDGFEKAVAFEYSQAAEKVRTNNHVERANRQLRFCEKVRYKWRQRKWVLRFVLMALDRWWSQAADTGSQYD